MTGLATHFSASVFWSVLYELVSGLRRRPSVATRIADGALIAAVACLVDYRLTPRRFTPGYEHRLSCGALALVYVAFAVGLGAGAQASATRRERRDR